MVANLASAAIEHLSKPEGIDLARKCQGGIIASTKVKASTDKRSPGVCSGGLLRMGLVPPDTAFYGAAAGCVPPARISAKRAFAWFRYLGSEVRS